MNTSPARERILQRANRAMHRSSLFNMRINSMDQTKQLTTESTIVSKELPVGTAHFNFKTESKPDSVRDYGNNKSLPSLTSHRKSNTTLT